MQKPFIIVSQLRQKCQYIRQSEKRSPEYQQLDLFDTGLEIKSKPQISCISGTSPHQENRYQVKLGNKILGDYLTIHEALKLSKQGGKR